MNTNKIRQQLQNGTTIQEVCQQYHISFKELCNLFLSRGCTTDKSSTGKLYVSYDGHRFILRKNNGYYGSYQSLDDALKVRDYMIMNGWYRSRLDKVCRELGVVRGVCK